MFDKGLLIKRGLTKLQIMPQIIYLECVPIAGRMPTTLRHVPYEKRLRQLNLFWLERRRLRADLILAFNICKGELDLNPYEFFFLPPRVGLRGHTYRLLQGPSRL